MISNIGFVGLVKIFFISVLILELEFVTKLDVLPVMNVELSKGRISRGEVK